MKRRLLSLVLAVTMLLSLLPTAVFALATDGTDFVVPLTTTVAVDANGKITGKVDLVDSTHDANMEMTLLLLPAYNDEKGTNPALTAILASTGTYLQTQGLSAIKGLQFTGPAFIKHIKGNATEIVITGEDLGNGDTTGTNWTDVSVLNSAKYGLPTVANLDTLYGKGGALEGKIAADAKVNGYPYELIVFSATKSASEGVYRHQFNIAPKSPAVLTCAASMTVQDGVPMTGNTLEISSTVGNYLDATDLTVSLSARLSQIFTAAVDPKTIAPGGKASVTLSLRAGTIPTVENGFVTIRYNSGTDMGKEISVPVTALPSGAAVSMTVIPSEIKISAKVNETGTGSLIITNTRANDAGATEPIYFMSQAGFLAGANSNATPGLAGGIAGASYSGIKSTVGYANDAFVPGADADNRIATGGGNLTVTVTTPGQVSAGTYTDTLILPYAEGNDYTFGTLSIPVTLTVTAAAEQYFRHNGTALTETTMPTTLAAAVAGIEYSYSTQNSFDVNNKITSGYTYFYADAAGAPSGTAITEGEALTNTAHNGKHLYAKHNASGKTIELGQLVVNAAPITTGSVAITVNKNNTGDASAVVTLGDASTHTITTTNATGVCTATGIAPGNYHIWVGNVDTGKTIVVTASATPVKQTLDYFTLLVTPTNGTVSAPSGGTGDYLAGSTVTVTTAATTNYSLATNGWAVTPTGMSISGLTATGGSVTIPDAVTGNAGLALTVKYIPNVTGVAITNGSTADIGAVLSLTVTTAQGTPSAGQVTYLWKNASGTTKNAATYTAVAGDAGKQITCTVTGDGTNYAGTITSAGVTINTAAALTITPVSDATWAGTVGGSALSAKSFTVKNIGGTTTGVLAAATLSDDTSSKFEITTNITGQTIAPNATAIITITPKADVINHYLDSTTETLTVATGVTQPLTISVAKGSQVTPTFTKTDCTTYGGNEGSITINNHSAQTYEWSGTDGGAIISAPGTVNGGAVTLVSAGTYYVRAAATADYNASAYAGPIVIADGKTYAGSVVIHVDDVATDLAKIGTVQFVGKDGTTKVAATGVSGTYTTAANALTSDQDPYTVHVTINGSTEITTTSAVSATKGTATATALDFYTVNYTENATHTNTYEGSEFATMATGTVSATAPIGVANAAVDLTTGQVVPEGTTVTFTVTDNETNTDKKAEYTPSWSGATGGTTTATHTYNAALASPVVATLTQKLYAVSGTATAEVDTVKAKGAGVVDIATTGTTARTINLPRGTYAFTATASGENVINGTNPVTGVEIKANKADAFAFTTSGPRYTIQLKGKGTIGANNTDVAETWVSVAFHYSTLPSQTITVTNSGNRDQWIKVEGTDPDFTLAATTAGITDANGVKVAKGATAQFTLTLVTGKAASATPYSGAYKVTAYKDGASTASGASATYTANQTVTAIPLTGVTITDNASGVLKVGTTLTATVVPDMTANGLTEADVTYKWLSGGVVSVTNADQSIYVVTAADEGKAITCEVTGKNNASGTKTSAATAKVNYTGTVTVKLGTVPDKTNGYALKLKENGGATEIALADSDKDGSYTTAVGALTGDKSYDLIVETVKGVAASVQTIENAVMSSVHSKEIVYYPVAFANAAELAPIAGASGTLTGPFAVTAAAGAHSITATNTPVLSGTEVTFTVADWANAEHTLSWTNATAVGSTLTATHTYSAAQSEVKATLTQKSYSVVGTADSGVTAVTLKDKAGSQTVFNRTESSGTTYSFTVAKGNYELIEVLAGGKVLDTTASGYLNPAELKVTANAHAAFKIATKAASTGLTAKNADDTSLSTYALTYNDAQPGAVTVTVTNAGDLPITGVKLTVADTNSLLASPLVSDDGLLAGVDIPAKGSKTFSVQVAPGLTVRAEQTATITATGKDWSSQDVKADYLVKVKVDPAKITAAEINEVAQPANGTQLDMAAAIVTGTPNFTVEGAVVWTGAETGVAGAGKVYTATVTLKPNANYAFDISTPASFVFNTKAGTADTVKMSSNNVTLTYTFAPTAPGAVAVTAAGTDWNAGKFTATATGTTNIEYYYVVDTAATTYATGDLLEAAVTNGKGGTEIMVGSAGSIADLAVPGLTTPDGTYYVNVVARIEDTTNGNSVWTAVKQQTFITWYKVVTAFTGHAYVGDTQPTMTPATNAATGVNGGTALTLGAVPTKAYWKFSAWVVAPAGGTLANSALHNTTYTAPAATGNGTAGTITLTATFVGAPLSVVNNYGTTGTYGTAYTGAVPTVTGGSGSYTYAVTAGALPAGLALNANTGAITGKPETVGDATFTVTVTDVKTGATKENSSVTITVAAATPVLATGYTNGTYYCGDAVSDAILQAVSTAKAPVLKTAAIGGNPGTWADENIAGSWTFNATGDNRKYGLGTNESKSYTHAVTFAPTASTLYSTVTTGTVSIAAIAKTYDIAVTTTAAPDPFVVYYGQYTAADTKITYTVKNNGNQTANVTYAKAGTNAAKFTMTQSSGAATLAPGAEATITLTVNDANLGIGTYAVDLTVTNTSNPDGTANATKLLGSLLVKPQEISGALVTNVVEPVKGAQPAATANTNAASGNYALTSVSWADKDGTAIAAPAQFAAGTQYKVTVVLTAGANYKFIEGAYKINGATANKVISADAAGNTATLTFLFPATAAGDVTATVGANYNSGTSQNEGVLTQMTTVSSVAVDFYYAVTTTAAVPTAQGIMDAETTPVSDQVPTAKGGSGNAKNVASSAGAVTWTGAKTITELAAGTQYWVHVIAVPQGATTAAGTAHTVRFTTHYEVTMGAAVNGTVTPAAGTVTHVKATESTNIAATAAAGYIFTTWTSSSGGTFGGATTAGTTFTPNANTTLTATFSGIPALKVSGGKDTGNEVGDNYDAALIDVFKGGIVTNIGGGAMQGNLAYKVVAKGGAYGDTAVDTFTVTFGTATLGIGANSTMVVHPKAGLTTDSQKPKTYEATIWVYDANYDTARDSFSVSITIVDSKGLIVNPGSYRYDVNQHPTTPNEDWAITVTEGSYNNFVSLKNGGTALQTPADYTYTVANKTGTLTIKKAYLDSLKNAATEEGMSATLQLAMKTSGDTTAIKDLVIRYIDTTPYLTGVSIAPNAGLKTGDTMTATVSASDLSTPTTGQVKYTWYRTAAATATGGTVVQATGNSNTYTIQSADAGFKFYVVADGDKEYYKGGRNTTLPKDNFVTSGLTSLGQFTVTTGVTPAPGGYTSPQKGYYDGTNPVQLLAAPTEGYTFVSWAVKSGTATIANPALAATTITATTDCVVTATFKKLPKLTIANAAYDTSATSPVEPVLTYTRNDGVYSKVTIAGPSATRDMTASDFSIIPTTMGSDGAYTLKATMLKGLSVGEYTISFVDTNAKYSQSVTMNISSSAANLVKIEIVNPNVVLGTELTTTLTPNTPNATYQWYYSATNSNASTATPIDGAIASTYTPPVDGHITVAGSGASLNISDGYLYVAATGHTTHTGTVKSPVKHVPNAEYVVTVEIATKHSATGKININNAGQTSSTVTVNPAEHNAAIPIVAQPDGSFIFTGWTIKTGTGTFEAKDSSKLTSTLASTNFYPTGAVTIVANFDALVVDKFEITDLEAPVKGAVPDTTATSAETGKYTVDSVTWAPADSPFLKDSVYKVTVTVTVKPGVTVDPSALGNTAGITSPGGNKVIASVTLKAGTLDKYEITYTYPKTDGDAPTPGGGGGGGGGTTTAYAVTYDLRELGSTKDKLAESVASGSKPKNVPAVVATEGLTFAGWSLENPETAKGEVKLVKPESIAIKADTTFFAVYTGHIIKEHERYMIGYLDGNFGPADNITRGEVATIIARAILPKFVEGSDYGDGGYNDVADHWAKSAIAFCTSQGVFVGYVDGSFKPTQPITRQEFAVVFARLAGIKTAQTMPFTDIDTAGDWAKDGIYTAYLNKWVDGYTDGTFKPLANIQRDEAVKITNRYLSRGVDEAGIQLTLKDLKTWPDVPGTYWAYYEIMEASNDHTFHYKNEKRPPENWTKAFIEKTSWTGK